VFALAVDNSLSSAKTKKHWFSLRSREQGLLHSVKKRNTRSLRSRTHRTIQTSNLLPMFIQEPRFNHPIPRLMNPNQRINSSRVYRAIMERRKRRRKTDKTRQNEIRCESSERCREWEKNSRGGTHAPSREKHDRVIPGRCVGLSWILLEEGVAILQQSMAVDGWWMDGGWMDGSMVNEEDG
jgi:hypothetical protein